MKRYIIWILLFSFAGCISNKGKNESVENTENNNSTVLTKNTHVNDIITNNSLEIVGAFSNVKDDGEHSSGYTIRLWKQNKEFYGMISGREFGMSGDPPAGLLENVQFYDESKKLKFKAKLSLGKVNDGVWSKDMFEFEGVLHQNKEIKGNIFITDELCPDRCPETKEVSFKKSKDITSLMSEYDSYEEWRSFVDEILKLRGPKW